MASIKTKFRPSAVAGQEGTIYYQIIHGRKVRQLSTPYRIFPTEWDDKRSAIATQPEAGREKILASLRRLIRKDVERLNRLIDRLETSDIGYTVDDLIDEFRRYEHDCSLFNFMNATIARLRKNGRVRTAEAYVSALNSFKRFRCNKDIHLDSITGEIMEEYQASLRARGVTLNTVSFYMRILRAVYNRATDRELVSQQNPFRHVYTGVDKTVKRALPLKTIKDIKVLDLSDEPALDYARDMFLMSFYLRGASFIDMAYMRKSDCINGHVTYRRRKTGQILTIEWTKEMQYILDKYAENPTDYLLPIIRNRDINERSAYRNRCYCINRNLKQIATRVGLDMSLTLYVARHSWASAAKEKGIPLSVICEGMGHDSETTTQIYLASLDSSIVDNANSLILSCLD